MQTTALASRVHGRLLLHYPTVRIAETAVHHYILLNPFFEMVLGFDANGTTRIWAGES